MPVKHLYIPEIMSEEIIHETLLESPISSPEPEDNLQCPACAEKIKDPIVLSCLHVFCMACLLKQVDETKSDLAVVSIICKKCEHETALPAGGLSELTPEYVLIDIMEMDNLSNDQIICTSCKAKELAVAKCEDCVNLLCKNCVTAHQFMRCFESHTLIRFDELKDGGKMPLHNPILCKRHSSQHLKMYCRTCEVVCCNECVTSVHKAPQHMVGKISDLEETEREALGKMIAEVKGKASECDDLSGNLTSSLGELQSQGDNAKDLINETFQSYKAILEKIKDDMLKELESLHSNKELALMDTCHNIEKLVEKMEDSIGFGEHVLNNGNGVQLMLMKKIIADRFSNLLGQVPHPEIDVNIEFETNSELFEEMTRKGFGHLKKDDHTVPERPLSSLQSSLDNEGFQYLLLSPDANKMPPQQELQSILPQTSMHSQFNQNYPNMANMPAQSLPMNRSHSTVESRSLSRCSHSPAMSDSGISVDAGSTNSNSSAPFVNIAALAKLGVDYNASGMAGCTGLSDFIAPTSDTSQVSGTKPTWSGACPPGMPSASNDRTSPWSEIGYPGRQPTPDLETLAGLLSRNPRPGSADITSQMPVLNTFNPINSMGNIGSNPVPNVYGAIGGNVGIAGRQSSNPGNTTPTLSASGTLSGSSNSINTVGSSQGMVTTTPPVRRFNKMSAMQIRCKFGQLGPGKGQFNSPHGFCLSLDEEIVVADTNNHRIQVFEKSGEFLYQFGIPGREEGQLWYPRKVAVMKKTGRVIVCDRGNERSRMQIFTKSGQFVRKIAIRYIDIVAGLAISAQGNIVAVDSVSPTVFVISENGDLIKWFDCSDYMREPSDIAIDGKEYFVCDFKAHAVVVFNEEGHFQRRIGCENITNYPNGIDISGAGDILVGDSHGNRFHVAVFQRDGALIGEFECPYVKVSRCCGLKITSEGYVVTLAKNNHHVLVLNTLYIS